MCDVYVVLIDYYIARGGKDFKNEIITQKKNEYKKYNDIYLEFLCSSIDNSCFYGKKTRYINSYLILMKLIFSKLMLGSEFSQIHKQTKQKGRIVVCPLAGGC